MGKEMAGIDVKVGEFPFSFGEGRVDIIASIDPFVSELSRRYGIPDEAIYKDDPKLKNNPLEAAKYVEIANSDHLIQDTETAVVAEIAKLQTAEENLKLDSDQKKVFEGYKENQKGALAWIFTKLGLIKDPEVRKKLIIGMVSTLEVLGVAGCVAKGSATPVVSAETLFPTMSPTSEVFTSTPEATITPTPEPTSTPVATSTSEPTPTATPEHAIDLTKVQIPKRGFIEKMAVNEPIFALTIDDGYSKKSMIQMLDILEQNNVQATFFIIGAAAEYDLGPELLKRLVEDGNEIAYHSVHHDQDVIATWNINDWSNDYEEWTKMMKELLGDELYAKGVKEYARAPGGAFTSNFLAMTRKYGLIPFGWNSAPNVWDYGVKPKNGDIFIIHVGYSDIANLDKYINLEDFEPVTLSDLIKDSLAVEIN